MSMLTSKISKLYIFKIILNFDSFYIDIFIIYFHFYLYYSPLLLYLTILRNALFLNDLEMR